MSRDIKYIGMDVHKEATVIAVLNGRWQAGDGVDRGNQSRQHSAVYPRSARRVACDLGRRDLGGLALRSAATPGGTSAGLRSAAQCLLKGRQQARQDRCAQAG